MSKVHKVTYFLSQLNTGFGALKLQKAKGAKDFLWSCTLQFFTYFKYLERIEGFY